MIRAKSLINNGFPAMLLSQIEALNGFGIDRPAADIYLRCSALLLGMRGSRNSLNCIAKLAIVEPQLLLRLC